MIEPDAYCRDIEAHLCRKNDGHLIRIVGPAFEQVSGWSRKGIPLNVVFAGIDRYFERYYRRGPRRRPVRVEFCEADVLDAFDDWRRAVGVTGVVAGTAGGQPDGVDEEAPTRRRRSLASHIERVIGRLTALRASSQALAALDPVFDRLTRTLDPLQGQARHARGEARETLVSTLAMLDQALMTAALEALDEASREAAEAEAREALGPFRDRMAPDVYQRACAAAFERSVRDRYRLPTIAFSE